MYQRLKFKKNLLLQLKFNDVQGLTLRKVAREEGSSVVQKTRS